MIKLVFVSDKNMIKLVVNVIDVHHGKTVKAKMLLKASWSKLLSSPKGPDRTCAEMR